LAIVVVIGYGPCLDNYFWEIDDQRHVANGAGLPFPNQYFRPGQEWSFRCLWPVAGTDPFFYYLTGLTFHWIAACLVLLLGVRLFRCFAPGLVAGLLFVSFFAPHQAVFWIGAHLGVQQVVFALAGLLCWLHFLESGGWFKWVSAFIFAGLALCFKECGLNLLPWMLVVQIGLYGFKDLFRIRRLTAWIPFLLLGGFIAYRAVSVPGGVGMEAHWSGFVSLAGRLLRSCGHLPLPLEYERWRYPSGQHWIGLSLFVAPIIGALLNKVIHRSRPLPKASRVSTGLIAVGLLLGGHMAILPGEPEIIGERFYYDAAPGFALLLAVLFSQVQSMIGGRKGFRHIPVVLLIAWIGINIFALHRIEERKYDHVSRRIEALVASTKEVIDHAPAREAILFLSPPIPDIEDFICILHVWLHIPEKRILVQPWFLPDNIVFRERWSAAMQEKPFRWDEERNCWIPFNPGGTEWLDHWKPKYWPGGLKDPNLCKEVRYITVLPEDPMPR
ncbi:MAG: hypothetical protein ABIK28_05575, partial [Planctomycetota bacterium]